MANTKITSRVLADNAVLTANITDANVTTAKVADNAVTGDKIADDVALAGNPTTTTQSAGNNTTRIATTAFVSTAVANLADSAPDALNTLNELAAAMGDDANFSTTVTNSIATKLPLAGGTITGDLNIDGNLHAGDGTDISMDSSANGQLEVDGDGYQGAIALDDTAMHLYHNSSSRSLIIGTNETARLTFGGSGNLDFHSNNLTSVGTISSGAITSTGGSNVFEQAKFGSSSSDNSQVTIGYFDANATNGLPALLNGSDFGGLIQGGENGKLVLGIRDNDASDSLDIVSGSGNFMSDSTYDKVVATFMADGNVGIGITDPDHKLEIGGAHSQLKLTDTDDDNYVQMSYSSDYLAFRMNSTTATPVLALNDTGNVGIGTTSPAVKGEIKNAASGAVATSGTTQTNGVLRLSSSATTGIIDFGMNGSNPFIQATDSTGLNNFYNLNLNPAGGNVGIGITSPATTLDIRTSNGSDAKLRIGSSSSIGLDVLGTIEFFSADADDSGIKASIHNLSTGNQGPGGSLSGNLIFSTTASDGGGNDSPTERMRILSDGYTSVNNDGAVASGRAGLHVEHGGLLINGSDASGTDAIGSSSHHPNYWTFIGSGGRSGARTGSFRIEVPEPTGGTTNHAYGGFSVEIYLAGYSGAFCHAMVSGYNNNGITISESAILRSGGSHSLSYGVLSGTNQGIYVDIDIPGYTHSSAYYRITKGGDTSSNHDTDFRNLKAIFT